MLMAFTDISLQLDNAICFGTSKYRLGVLAAPGVPLAAASLGSG
jgi:hypothetical protein